MRRTLVLVFGLLMMAAACTSGSLDPAQFKGTLLPTPILAPDFTLTHANGEAVQLSDYRGKTVLLYFGYTFCPDVCPTTMADLGRLQRQLDDAGEEIQVIMITVDPARDTPEQMAAYVEHFHPSFVGLSGSKEEIDAAAEAYGVFYELHEGTAATGYLVDHTARVFVIDPQGQYRLSFPFGMAVEDMADDLHRLQRAA